MIKYLAIITLIISNIFTAFYLYENPEMFSNMFKYEFQPAAGDIDYIFASFIVLCDIFLISMNAIVFVFFKNEFIDIYVHKNKDKKY